MRLRVFPESKNSTNGLTLLSYPRLLPLPNKSNYQWDQKLWDWGLYQVYTGLAHSLLGDSNMQAELRTAAFPHTGLLYMPALCSGMRMEVMTFHIGRGWGVVHMWGGVLKGGSRRKCLICICTSGTPRSQGTWGPPSFKGLDSLREMAEGFQGKVVRS